MNSTYTLYLYLVIKTSIKNQQARKQCLIVRDRTRRVEEREMREEEEDRLHFENLGVDSILQNYDDDRFD